MREDSLCHSCGLQVYQAEAIPVGGKKYHKACHKCRVCSKLLSSATAHLHCGELHCRTCFAQATRPASPALFSDTSVLKPSNDSQACPVCGGAVFEAEKVTEKGRFYHKRCFTCCKCKRPQDDKLQVYVGSDSKIYCSQCCPRHAPLPPEVDTRKILASEGSGCPRCLGKVFEAEKITIKAGTFHKICFSCQTCRQPLNYSNFVSDGKQVYCHGCYKKTADTARSRSVGPADLSSVKGPASESCGRCGGIVYQPELLRTKRQIYHRSCLSCRHCRAGLQPFNLYEAEDSEIYCKACYAVLFGHKRAKSLGPSSASAVKAGPGEAACLGCGFKVFEAERVGVGSGCYHESCFKCCNCSSPLSSTTANTGPGGKMFCNKCIVRQTRTTPELNQIFVRSHVDTVTIAAAPDDPDMCVKCGGKVFIAERRAARSGNYHAACFTCMDCKRLLDYSSACDGREGELLCSACYAKKYHVTNIRPAVTTTPVDSQRLCGRCGGAVVSGEEQVEGGTMFHRRCVDTRPTPVPGLSHIKAGQGEEQCFRCHGKIFEPERLKTKSAVFHRKCFSCKVCSKLLESSLSDAFSGPDSDIYCRKCYKDNFDSKTTVAYSDPKSIVALDGKGCPRCNGKVFTAEQIVEKGRNFHVGCFSCKLCKKPLSNKLQVSVGFDEEVYCKNCYPKIQQSPLINGGSDTATIKGDENESCPRCKGKVFDAEKMKTKKKVFHKKCFNCKQCHHSLSYNSMFCDKDGEIFCKTCYLKIYFVGKTNHYLNYSRGQPVETETGPEGCVRCRVKVYQAERVMTRAGPYHLSCLTCNNCSRTLDTTNFYDGASRGVFCRHCYAVLHGHRSRSQSRAPVDYAQFEAEEDDPNKCQGCNGKIFETEKLTTCFGSFHSPCFKCVRCERSLVTSIDNACSRNGKILCKQCFNRERSISRKEGNDEDGFLTYVRSIVDSQVIPANEDDPNRCQRCSGKVFDAERMSMKCGQFHKKCFSCFECRRPLDYITAADSSIGEVFCRSCYSKNFGPRALMVEDDSRHKTDTIRPSEGDAGCPRCGFAVFDAEKVVAQGRSYHSRCARCSTCKTLLNSLNITAAKDGSIFCGGCYSRKFGGASYRGAQTQHWVEGQKGSGPQTYTEVATIRQAEDGGGCARCSGVVYEAEKIIVSPELYFHKSCFSCKLCAGALDVMKLSIGPDKEIYCKSCYKEVLEATRSYSQAATDTIRASEEDRTGCPRCGGVVYDAEKIMTKYKCFHKNCISCLLCKHKLEASTYVEGPKEEVYCKTCYSREFGDNSRNMFGERTGIRADAGDKSGCLRCGDKVFSVDKVLGKTGVYHKQCLSCGGCGTKLSVTSYSCGADGDIYCRHCYGARFGVRGRAGSIKTTDIMARQDDPDMCLRCGGKVFSAEKMMTTAGLFHQSCFRCVNCNRNLDQNSANCGQDGEIYCRQCYQEEFGTFSRRSRSRATSRPRARSRSSSIPNLDSIEGNRIIAGSLVNTTSIKAKEGDKDACPRCSGKVFEAEKMVSRYGVYHRKCFTCEECRRGLDSNSMTEGPNGSIYCGNCYLRNFGPTVRQFDEEQARKYLEAALSSVATDPNQKACPRCKCKVYPNEELYSAGNSYHRRCAKCSTCGRQLDFNSIYDGADKDIYCKGCYGRKFGTAGFRGNNSSSWTDESSSLASRPSSQMKMITSDDDSLACVSCYSCVECSKTLEPASGCYAPNREVYCKGCYSKQFGPTITPTAGGENKNRYHYTQFF